MKEETGGEGGLFPPGVLDNHWYKRNEVHRVIN